MSARRSHTVLACAAALVAVVAVGACFSLNLAGHPCNDKHGCVDGFTCVSDVCLASRTAAVDADAGTARDAGNDAGNDDDDAGVTDAGIVDAGFVDGGFVDGGAPSDAGFVDAGDVDAGPGPDVDAGFVDAGPPAVCGDGVADELEECDDGNVLAGDGCSSSCTTEVGFACFGSPSVCCAATRVRRVPADFATIGQAAINAGSGGCVFVSAGDYAGPTLQTDISLVGAGAPTLHNDAQGGNNNPTLSVSHRLLLQGFGVSTSSENASAIVISSGGLLTMRDDDVGPAGKLCVDESGFEASINVTRSVFHGCAGGALRLRGAGTCSVASSFVVGNGGTSSGLAPLQVQRACTLTSLTVANNVANSSNAGALGVDCSNGGGGTTLTRSIVWGNTSIFTGVSQSGEIRTCTTSFDDFEGATGGAGATNIALDPVFVGGGDVHLAPTSPCIDAITDSDHSVDIDGQLRPLGAGDDIGADEAR